MVKEKDTRLASNLQYLVFTNQVLVFSSFFPFLKKAANGSLF